MGGRAPRGAVPEFAPGAARYDVSDRVQAIPYGGLGAVHQLAREVGLVRQLDARLPILMKRRPYSESDHILNIAFNVLCGGTVLDDIEVRRNDAAFLDAVGARRSPDDRRRLLPPVRHGPDRDADGRGQRRPCGRLAATRSELLRADGEDRRRRLDRGDARREQGGHGAFLQRDLGLPPAAGVAREHGRAALHREPEWQPALPGRRSGLLRPGGRDVPPRWLQGRPAPRDTAFSQTLHFDRWTKDGIRFVFGYDAVSQLVETAETLPRRSTASWCARPTMRSMSASAAPSSRV